MNSSSISKNREAMRKNRKLKMARVGKEEGEKERLTYSMDL